MNLQHVDLFIQLVGVLFASFAVLMLSVVVRHFIKRARDKKGGVEPPSH